MRQTIPRRGAFSYQTFCQHIYLHYFNNIVAEDSNCFESVGLDSSGYSALTQSLIGSANLSVCGLGFVKYCKLKRKPNKTDNVGLSGETFWKLNTSISKDQNYKDKMNTLIIDSRTLKPAFNFLAEWWDDLKLRFKNVSIAYCSYKKCKENL